MDVQAGEASVRSDPPPTVSVPASATPAPNVPRAVHQGTFFQEDPYPTFATTDPTPVVVTPRGQARRIPPTSRGLRIAVIIAALAVVAAGSALALVETGTISTTGTSGRSHTAAPPPVTHSTSSTASTATTAAPRQTLVTPAGFAGPQNASYTVDAKAFGLTIKTSTGRSWVSVGIVGQQPIFVGILAPDASKQVTMLGPAQLSIGAGGTTVTVASGRHTQTLTPPSAPFTYQFTPR
jgi:hypothetical protein